MLLLDEDEDEDDFCKREAEISPLIRSNMYSSLVMDVNSICDSSEFTAVAIQRRRNLLSWEEVFGPDGVVAGGFEELAIPGLGAVFSALGVLDAVVVLLGAELDEEGGGAAALLPEFSLDVAPAAWSASWCWFWHLVDELLRASCNRNAAPAFSSTMSAYIGEPHPLVELALQLIPNDMHNDDTFQSN